MNIDFNLCWQKIQKNDEYAFEELYKAAFKPLLYYACEIIGQQQLAEEVVQDVFLKIWKKRSLLSVRGSVKAYLFQSVHNHSLNTIRKQNTKAESVNQLRSEETWRFISDNYYLNEDFIERIFSDETQKIITRIVDKLPEKCRKVFLLSRVESMDNRTIASRLGLSENTVKTHIYRALHEIAGSLLKEF